MADDGNRTYERLYSELPAAITGNEADRYDGKGNSNADALKDFLHSHIPPSDRKEIEPELKKTTSTRKQKSKNKIKMAQPTKRKGKYLTSRERRELGLAKLPKKSSMRYVDFVPLNALWREYMAKVVDLSKYRPGDEQFQMRLCRADYHGALIKITRAKCPSLLGMQGIIVMETRNTFRLISDDDVVRTVPKAGVAFSFELGGSHLMTFAADNMCMKPSDRAVKKWKNRLPLPL